ncbi:phage holin family protein [Sphingobacterium multivorum]|uniref:phage holin family protein n=1 Tax=Sphingobacterium multivorum TaxID=28454 RepID=UPI0028AD8404|nr:phage holin family protein [Sphingobacterium multivorum]
MESNMEKVVVTVWIVFGLYCGVLFMILADLWSGVRKARKNGVIRSSYGFRRTVEKLTKYYNLLVVMTLIDAMQMSAIWYMEVYYQKSFILFPFITLVGALGISLIEVKSIYEKAEDKVKLDEVGSLAGKIWANKDDIQEIAKSVAEYMKAATPTKTTVKITTEQKGENNNEALASTEPDMSAN